MERTVNDELKLEWMKSGDRWFAVKRFPGASHSSDTLASISQEEYFRLSLAGQLESTLMLMDVADKYGVYEDLLRASA